MGGRFVVTGAQLGMLIAYSKLGCDKELRDTIKNITEEQFIFHSKRKIEEDVKILENETRRCMC